MGKKVTQCSFPKLLMSPVLNSGNNFKGLFAETAMLISVKFHMQSLDIGNKGKNVYSNGHHIHIW